jgi:flagellar FliL protein
MTAEAEIDEGAAAAPAKKSKLKLIIIAAAALVVIAGGAATFFVMSSSSQHAEEAAHVEAATVPTSFVFNLPPMTVNLNSEGTEQSFMRLTIALEVADQAMMITIQPKMAKVIDAFQVYLRELRRSDLEGSAGIYRLKEELLRRVNLAIAPAVVESVLFKEILVQ